MKFNLLLKVLLVIHGLNEAGYGLFLLLKPADACGKMGCGDLGSETVIMLAGMYGAAAFCIGLLSLRLSMINDYSALFRACIWGFCIFHLSMTLNQLLRSPDIMGAAVHAVFGMLFIASAIKLMSHDRAS